MLVMASTITIEEFLKAARDFLKISDRLCDDWRLEEKEEIYKSCLKKETFININDSLLKAEFVVFYNMSYGVPSFSFNIWNSSGTLLSLENIRQMSVIQINQKDFYSVITQQEHPIFCRPYFIVHPCQTEALLATFKDKSKNIIVTFMGLIGPLLPQLHLEFEYGI